MCNIIINVHRCSGHPTRQSAHSVEVEPVEHFLFLSSSPSSSAIYIQLLNASEACKHRALHFEKYYFHSIRSQSYLFMIECMSSQFGWRRVVHRNDSVERTVSRLDTAVQVNKLHDANWSTCAATFCFTQNAFCRFEFVHSSSASTLHPPPYVCDHLFVIVIVIICMHKIGLKHLMVIDKK